MAQQDKMARDHRRGRQDVMNAVTRQDVGPLRFGGEAWLRNLQMRRSKINYENRSFVDYHCEPKIGVLWTVTVITKIGVLWTVTVITRLGNKIGNFHFPFLLILVFALTNHALGFDQPIFSIAKSRLIASYMEVAFVSGSDLLVKPQTDKPTNIMVQCAANEGCDSSVAELRKYLKASWIGLIQTKNFDPQNLISVILYSNPSSDDIRLGASLHYDLDVGQKLFQEGIIQCKVLAFHTELTVNRVVLYVDQTMQKDKVISCIMLELIRATGLDVGPRFQTQWEQGGPLISADEKTFNQAMRGLERLFAIHLLPSTKPGMDQTQLKFELEKLSYQQLIGE
jgi:hypothetical protein